MDRLSRILHVCCGIGMEAPNDDRNASTAGHSINHDQTHLLSFPSTALLKRIVTHFPIVLMKLQRSLWLSRCFGLCRAAATFVPPTTTISFSPVRSAASSTAAPAMTPKSTKINSPDSIGDVTSNQDGTIAQQQQQQQPWQVFPAHHWERLREEHGERRVKLVHILRHAEGTHNVNMEYKSEINIDARLTDKGHAQCQALASRILQDTNLRRLLSEDTKDMCIVTSPLTRCVQTALHSFPHLIPHVPVLAHEAWRETVNYNCDRRRHVEEIQKEFPHVNFDSVTEFHDAIWQDYRQRLGDDWDTHMESAELYRVAQRGLQGLLELEQRPESQVVVCTHSAFLRCILNWGQEGGVPKLMTQRLDDRKDKTSTKLFEYASDEVVVFNDGDDGTEISFEEYMRRDFENCELRSFCMLVQSTTSS